MNKILCIIPARGGSKGLVGKNTRPLLNKPLLGWTIEAAKKSKYIDRIVVSTDDEHIKKVSKEYAAEIINRPASLATDHSSTMEVIAHTLNYLSESEKYIPDFVLLLQCTSPLRTEKHIDEAIEKLLDDRTNADSLISVTKEEHPPWWLRKINTEGYIERYFNFDTENHIRRQDFCELFRPNGAIYLAKTNLLLERKAFQTDRTLPYIMDNVSSVDIDTEHDFNYTELVMKTMLED